MNALTTPLESKKKTTDKDIYQEIFEAILMFRLQPGTKLTEEDMSQIFGVGRTTIRRALVRLAHDHIVEIEPNKGAYVASPSAKQAVEIIGARRAIEAAIVADVCKNASKEDFQALRELVSAEQDSNDHKKVAKGVRLSGDFHLMLAKISANTTLERIITTLVPQTSLVIVLYEKPGQPQCSHIEHFDLIDVMEKGDIKSAVALMDEHLVGIQAKLKLNQAGVSMSLTNAFKKRS
jgi:DNA-binding GntR family transcriptional regulator